MFYIAVWTRNAGDILGNRYSDTSVSYIKEEEEIAKVIAKISFSRILIFYFEALKSSNVAIMRR